jgi:outer membrane protein assembly factor BamB
MTGKTLRSIALILAVAFLGSGCAATDMMGKWFSTPHKSKIRGERISIMATDESAKPDVSLKDVPVQLPQPYRNTEWPQPGGYASNVMYHLEASGPLHKVWDADAGSGSDTDSRLTAAPIVAGGKVYVLDATARVFAFNTKDGEEAWHVTVAPKGHRDLINALSLGLFG